MFESLPRKSRISGATGVGVGLTGWAIDVLLNDPPSWLVFGALGLGVALVAYAFLTFFLERDDIQTAAGSLASESSPSKRQRRLSETQRQALIAETRGFAPKGKFSIVYFSGSEEAIRFAAQIAKALQSAGWEADCDRLITERIYSRGVTLAKPIDEPAPHHVNALARGLESAGIEFAHLDSKYPEPRLFIDMID